MTTTVHLDAAALGKDLPCNAAHSVRVYHLTGNRAGESSSDQSRTTAGNLNTSKRHEAIEAAMRIENNAVTLQKLRHYIESLCGIYSRVARRMGVDRTYVSRVAKGERHSPEVEKSLIGEFKRTQEETK